MTATSMTGFAREVRSEESTELVWEIRSVNHRHLEAQIRLPDSCRPLEPELRSILPRYVRRGKIDASLSVQGHGGDGGGLRVDETLAVELIGHAENIAQRMANPSDLDPFDVLRWPGVVEPEPVSLDSIQALAVPLFEQALSTLSESRAREGARLGKLISTRCDSIESRIADIRQRIPVVLEGIRARWKERIEDLRVTVDESRIEQEIVMAAQKLDIAEELDRLDGHLIEIRNALASEDPAGRRIDFLVQELNREANTLSAKSPDTELTRAAVDIKVLIEQMREQSQNLE